MKVKKVVLKHNNKIVCFPCNTKNKAQILLAYCQSAFDLTTKLGQTALKKATIEVLA